MENKKLIVYTYTEDLNEFEKAAAMAKKIGATNMVVSNLPRSRWMWESDLSDPYTNWSMSQAQLFKMVCPPELQKYLPQNHIAQCMELVKKRCEILKKYGMNGAIFSNEPFWLPEAVFRDHPDWRGARCDHPRRSRKPYYSPCIDHPEVLAMYRYAIAELCRETGVDFFNIKSNDAGGGICWSNGTYVGPNGPQACKTRPMAERICGFMDALTDGARDGGVEAVIHFNTNIGFKDTEASVDAVYPSLKGNQVVNGKDRYGKKPISCVSSMGHNRPAVLGIPRMVDFSDYLRKALRDNCPYVVIEIPKTDFGEEELYAEKVLKSPATDTADCFRVLKECAAELAGEKCAGSLVDAWYKIDESYLHLSHTGLNLIMYGCLHQRWINRPFVLFPMELTEEEKSYYRRFQFQALTEEDAADLMNLQGIEGVRGFTSAFLITETINKAKSSISEAVGVLKGLLNEANCKLDKEKLSLLIRRLEIQKCFMTNIANAVQFQELLDRIDYENAPKLSLRWPTRNDHRIEEFQNISMAEIENAYRLADLIEGYEKQVLTVTDEAHEDVFLYGPHLAEQLRKKAEIMLNHILDANRVFETHNV